MWHWVPNKSNSIIIQYLKRNWVLICVSFVKSHIEKGSAEFWIFKWKKKALKKIGNYLKQTSNFLFCLRVDLQVMVKLGSCFVTDIYKTHILIELLSSLTWVRFWNFFLGYFLFLFLTLGVHFLLWWCNISLLWSSGIHNIAQSIFHPAQPN